MLPEEQDLYGWVDLDHWQRWRDALAQYRDERGRSPDRHWRALLRLATITPNLWAHVSRHVIYSDGVLRPEVEAVRGLSQGEWLVLRAALNLFRGTGTVNLAEMADALGLSWWGVFVAALDDYREGR